MSITPERKAELIKEYAVKEGDSGSPEVQVAILTEDGCYPSFASRLHKRQRRGAVQDPHQEARYPPIVLKIQAAGLLRSLPLVVWTG